MSPALADKSQVQAFRDQRDRMVQEIAEAEQNLLEKQSENRDRAKSAIRSGKAYTAKQQAADRAEVEDIRARIDQLKSDLPLVEESLREAEVESARESVTRCEEELVDNAKTAAAVYAEYLDHLNALMGQNQHLHELRRRHSVLISKRHDAKEVVSGKKESRDPSTEPIDLVEEARFPLDTVPNFETRLRYYNATVPNEDRVSRIMTKFFVRRGDRKL